MAASYSGPRLDILIDQGRDDQFLSASQLLPDNLIAVCSEKKIPVVFRLQPVGAFKVKAFRGDRELGPTRCCRFLLQGYDHSYFFIYSFISDHIKHHAKYLAA